MLRFSANISTLFTEHALLERPAAAAAAGFQAIEVQFPYEVPAADFAGACRRAQIDVAMFNIAAGDFQQGGAGLAAVPDRRAAFADAVAEAIAYAEALRPRTVNVIAGRLSPALPADDCLAVLAENLNLAARRFADMGIGVTIEAINTRDVPGYPVATTEAAVAIIDRADHDNLSLQYDAYHMQIMEGDLLTTLTTHLTRIGHIQFADNPGRHEPGTGEINYENVFAAVGESAYAGWVGAEYRPSQETTATLGWLTAS